MEIATTNQKANIDELNMQKPKASITNNIQPKLEDLNISKPKIISIDEILLVRDSLHR